MYIKAASFVKDDGTLFIIFNRQLQNNAVTRCGAFVVWVCVGASQMTSLSLLARNPHKGLAREISHEIRSGRGKEGLREQSAGESSQEKDSQQKGAEQVSQEMRVGQRGDQSTEVRKAAARTCWPTDAGLTNARRRVSIPCGFLEVLRKFTTVTVCKCTESCSKCYRLLPSCAWS